MEEVCAAVLQLSALSSCVELFRSGKRIFVLFPSHWFGSGRTQGNHRKMCLKPWRNLKNLRRVKRTNRNRISPYSKFIRAELIHPQMKFYFTFLYWYSTSTNKELMIEFFFAKIWDNFADDSGRRNSGGFPAESYSGYSCVQHSSNRDNLVSRVEILP